MIYKLKKKDKYKDLRKKVEKNKNNFIFVYWKIFFYV